MTLFFTVGVTHIIRLLRRLQQSFKILEWLTKTYDRYQDMMNNILDRRDSESRIITIQCLDKGTEKSSAPGPRKRFICGCDYPYLESFQHNRNLNRGLKIGGKAYELYLIK